MYLIKMSRFLTRRRLYGGALVELAVTIPIILSITFGFWDVGVRLFALERMESLLTVYIAQYTVPLLRVTTGSIPTPDGGTLITAELETPSTERANLILDNTNGDLKYLLQNSGSGAAQSKIEVVSEMYYADIFNEYDDPMALDEGCEGILPGYAFRVTRVGDQHKRTGDDCFGATAEERAAVFADFDAFVASISNKLVCPDTATTPPFGTRNFSAYWDGTLVSDTEVSYFASKRAFMVVGICVNPPKVFSDEPVMTYHVIFPSKEASF